MRHLVILMLLVAGLAGCAGTPGPITAMEGIEPALQAAQKFGEAPRLVGIMSVEPFQHIQGDDYEAWIHLDKDPADGRAPGWIYVFAAGDRTVGIAYASGMGVIAEGYEVEDASDAVLAPWKLDSDDVAAILRDHEDWPEPQEDISVFWELRMVDDRPVWFTDWINETRNWSAAVDAVTGNVTIQEHALGEYAVACTQSFSMAPEVVTPIEDATRDVDARAGAFLSGWVHISRSVGSVDVVVTGPEGVVFEAVADAGEVDIEVPDVAGGTYTLTVSNGAGVTTLDAVYLSAC